MPKILKYICLVYLTITGFSCSLKAQFHNYTKEDFIWFEGSVNDENGKEYKGKLNYNFISDVLKLKLKNGNEKIFTANSILYFKFITDNDTIKYFSLSYDLTGMGYARYSFYRVEYESRDDIIVSKNIFDYQGGEGKSQYIGHPSGVSTLSSDGTVISGPPSMGSNGSNILKRELVERSVFINSKGNMQLIFTGRVDKSIVSGLKSPKQIENEIEEIKKSESISLASEKEVKNYKLMNRDFIKDLYPNHYEVLNSFIKKNKIKFKSIDDLVVIINKKCELEKQVD